MPRRLRRWRRRTARSIWMRRRKSTASGGGEYHPKRRICGYGIDLFCRRADGTWDREGEYHEEYAYAPEELEAFLRDAGFAWVKQYGDLKRRAPKAGEMRIFFAAGKETKQSNG